MIVLGRKLMTQYFEKGNYFFTPHFQSRNRRFTAFPPCETDPSRRTIGTSPYQTATALKTDVFKAVYIIWDVYLGVVVYQKY